MKIVRVPALTGLRFVAAMMVLIGHGLYAAHFAADTMTSRILDPLPSMGMTLFFVLSGFVMWVNYAQSFRERFWSSLWCFGVARFARLRNTLARTQTRGLAERAGLQPQLDRHVQGLSPSWAAVEASQSDSIISRATSSWA